MRLVSLLFHDVYAADPAETGFTAGSADRYKLTVAAFEAALAAIARANTRPPVLAPAIGSIDPRAYAITVDDGGVSYYTHIAPGLEARGWRGHCFMTTGMIGRPGFLTRAQLRELDARGHVIGSHSATHPTRFSACPPARMLEEWRTSRAELEDLLGHEVRVASLPGGYFSMAVARTAADAGYTVLFISEPVMTARQFGPCALVGRHTLFADSDPALAHALVARERAALHRQWLVWNAKKLLKPVLGPAYPLIGAWASRRQAAVHAAVQSKVSQT
jgi:peptidoglycan/xylan/chitin deacetylase (PgdA/CDA1 family)